MSLLTQLQIRRDTSANWTTVNPVLAVGELGLETDTGHLRAGDGSSVWTQLTTAFKRVNPRTAPQLTAAPTSTDIALGAGALFVGPDNLLRYINAAGSAFVTIDIAAMVAATTSAANAASSAAGVAGAAQTAAAAAIPLTQKGAASGVATLGSDSKVPTSQMTGKLATTDLTDVATAITAALAAKQNIPIFWNGTTPALVSSTNPVPAFGSNAFLYTGAGGAVLDGNTFQTGDLALWNGTVFMKEIFGGGYLGTFASTAALQTAYPAASNVDCDALVAGVLYKSDGTAWQKNITGAQVGVASGVASLDSGGKVPVAQLPNAVLGALNYQGTYNASTNTPAIVAGNKGFYWKVATAGTALGYTWNVGDDVVDNGTTIDKIDGIASEVVSVAGRTGAVTLTTADLTDLAATLTTPIANNTSAIATNTNATVQVTGNVTISVANANAATYNGKTLEFTGAFSVTIGAGLPNDFGFAGIPPASGNASIVSDGTTTFNGATTTQTRAYATQAMFTVTQRNTNHNQYVVV